jgi:hypothetical protein
MLQMTLDVCLQAGNVEVGSIKPSCSLRPFFLNLIKKKLKPLLVSSRAVDKNFQALPVKCRTTFYS